MVTFERLELIDFDQSKSIDREYRMTKTCVMVEFLSMNIVQKNNRSENGGHSSDNTVIDADIVQLNLTNEKFNLGYRIYMGSTWMN